MGDARFVLSPADAARCQSIVIQKRGVVYQIACAVSVETGLPVADILGRRRFQSHVEARQLVMYLAKQQGLSYSKIARAMGLDHTTIMHGVKAEAARRAVE